MQPCCKHALCVPLRRDEPTSHPASNFCLGYQYGQHSRDNNSQWDLAGFSRASFHLKVFSPSQNGFLGLSARLRAQNCPNSKDGLDFTRQVPPFTPPLGIWTMCSAPDFLCYMRPVFPKIPPARVGLYRAPLLSTSPADFIFAMVIERANADDI